MEEDFCDAGLELANEFEDALFFLAWRDWDYVDSGWLEGDSMLGNGLALLGTTISYPTGALTNATTIYFRKEFIVNDPSESITNLKLEAAFDDAFVIYLNGTEVARSASMPTGSPNFGTEAATAYNSVGYEVIDLSSRAHLLRLGGNVLAVEIHQARNSAEDVLWDGALSFDLSTTPTLSAPVILPPSGEFARPVQVSLSAVEGAAIFYSLNGIDPDESSWRYTAPFTVQSTSEIRARAYKAGFNDSPVSSSRISIIPSKLSAVLSNDSIQITLRGAANADYLVESSTDLIQWTTTAEIRTDAAGSGLFTEIRLQSAEGKFYRGRAK